VKEIITSSKNPDIKLLKKLYRTKNRREMGKYILEGNRIIKHALKTNNSFDMVFMIPEYENEEIDYLLKKHNIETRYIDKKLLLELTDTISPQGIIAIVNKPEYNLDNINNMSSILTLDAIQDPGNMGTLIRTAEAAGLDCIIALKGCVDIYNLKVIRATMGAIFNIPVFPRVTVESFKNIISRNRIDVICTDPDGEDYYFEPEYKVPLTFVIGNEARGIRPELLKIANKRVKIPLEGKINSLNAAISGAIVIYEYIKNEKYR